MAKEHNNWCPEIYRSLYIDRFNDNFVQVAPCCQAESRIESVETFDFNTSPYLNQLRAQFDLGQQPSACHRCWHAEQHGHKSRRQSAIEFFQVSEPDCTVELQSIDHSATWACNLACIMCGPNSSSQWAKQKNLDRDDLHRMGRLFQQKNNIINNIDVSCVKKIHFNGGEPLLNDDHFELLSKLEEHNVLKNVFISYNTNGTVMPSKKIVELWNKTRLVKIFFSIDAIGSAFEYIRWPGKWSQTSKNILDMKDNLSSNVMFGFNVTVGSYNLLEVKELYHWFTQHIKTNREGDPADFCWQFANNFDLKYLSRQAKLAGINQLQSIPEVNGIVNYLKTTINYNEDSSWTTKLSAIDATRNTNWKQDLQIGAYY